MKQKSVYVTLRSGPDLGTATAGRTIFELIGDVFRNREDAELFILDHIGFESYEIEVTDDGLEFWRTSKSAYCLFARPLR